MRWRRFSTRCRCSCCPITLPYCAAPTSTSHATWPSRSLLSDAQPGLSYMMKRPFGAFFVFGDALGVLERGSANEQLEGRFGGRLYGRPGARMGGLELREERRPELGRVAVLQVKRWCRRIELVKPSCQHPPAQAGAFQNVCSAPAAGTIVKLRCWQW